ncbi:MAG: Asp-tRNA(Asn)/Glu-tRNA(Gln) amidotransferase subunit GatB [Cyclobacteriaceae bacterium]|nr:Asp-tRNA(Asn)/Glu-tRNA(Gln) amidotransferase subunit GatB [Cyclobacteriaceae bacterium]
MMSRDGYEVVIGLEVHVQLATESKIFSSDVNSFGGNPNENISAVTIAHPGTLPLINKKAVDYAIKMGLALGCTINRELIFDRKNYFYPDLPKGYQITQDTTPICVGGGLEVVREDGQKKFIELTKIHLEEDAGKSMHVEGEDYTLVDLNRAGVPLIEIVTEPVLRTPEEAALFLAEIRKIIRYLGISDGNMEEGSMRCDANVSIRKAGEPLGSKVEVKNMNSIRNVTRAILFEIERQTDLKQCGKTIFSETRTFNPTRGDTTGMRTKEELNDYRYFPEPDISPLSIDEEWIRRLQAEMPELPQQLKARFENEYGLPAYDAGVLTEEKEIADYFLDTIGHTTSYKAVSNWLMGPVKSYLNEKGISIQAFPLAPARLADLLALVQSGTVSHTAASQQLFGYLLEHPDESAEESARKLNLVQEGNPDRILALVEEVLGQHPDKVKAYLNGKKALTGMFMGEVMKKAGGTIDPKETSRLIIETLESKR